jgi:aerotaxis receptor
VKKNLPVTQVEHRFAADANILSTTNLKGAITYVNDDFVAISGFNRAELIGKNHNIVRHPDMPPAAFADLWATLKAGRSWMGIVKNRCKNGDHYWIDAFATPIARDGEVAEYQSVRRQPAAGCVERAEQLYPRLMAGNAAALLRRPRLPWWLKCAAPAGLAAVLALVALMLQAGSAIVAALIVLAAIGAGVGIGCAHLRLAPMLARCRAITCDPVAQFVYTGSMDEFGELELAITMLESESAALIGRVTDASHGINHRVMHMNTAIQQARASIDRQQMETDQVATAMNQMAATIQEVATSAQSASETASQGKREVVDGRQIVDASLDAIVALKQAVAGAAGVIRALETESQNISGVLDVIRGIAEQTNLLALNAAIEAARAGEAGRGFSVVADEVRSLATRTQASTQEIRDMIERLQRGANDAVVAMESGHRQAESCAGLAERAAGSLESIHRAIELIEQMNLQIATAVEEQSVVTEQMNTNVVSIRDLSTHNAAQMGGNADASAQVEDISTGLLQLTRQFWSRKSRTAH